MLPACVAGFVGVARELHAAGLAAAAHLHLGLHHHRVADAVGAGDGLVDGVGNRAVGHRNAVTGEQLLALVLEQIHASSPPERVQVQKTTGRVRTRADRGPPRASR